MATVHAICLAGIAPTHLQKRNNLIYHCFLFIPSGDNKNIACEQPPNSWTPFIGGLFHAKPHLSQVETLTR